MLWTIFAILLILWLLGFSFHVAGSLIHLLLVAAVIVLMRCGPRGSACPASSPASRNPITWRRIFSFAV
ncbi:MAG: lmo0937 family membrane protein [Acidobacteria bacterium]|nr:MAG: lmo0937 family membrane protein [Acidobacteriota bacterium]